MFQVETTAEVQLPVSPRLARERNRFAREGSASVHTSVHAVTNRGIKWTLQRQS